MGVGLLLQAPAGHEADATLGVGRWGQCQARSPPLLPRSRTASRLLRAGPVPALKFRGAARWRALTVAGCTGCAGPDPAGPPPLPVGDEQHLPRGTFPVLTEDTPVTGYLDGVGGHFILGGGPLPQGQGYQSLAPALLSLRRRAM